MLQKTYTEGFMTGKKVKNVGLRCRYYVKNSHPAIIPAEVFDKVQEEMAWRARLIHKEDGTAEASVSKYNVNIWGICLCAAIAERHIKEERKGVRWFGDVQQG